MHLKALLLAVSCSVAAHAGDAVLFDVDEAFALLGSDSARAHAQARARLERAARAFDDLSPDEDPLRAAFLGDRTKPWRGRTFERVLSLVTLAALDIERHRCDLALPALKTAALHDARVDVEHKSDAVVVHALLLRCLADGDEHTARGTDDEIASARRMLKDVVGNAAEARRIERFACDPAARLVFMGFGPSFHADGAHGEHLTVRPGDEGDGVAAVIALGPRAQRNDLDLDLAGAAVVWSSNAQATTTRGRPWERVLAERAAAKDALTARGSARVAQGLAPSSSSSSSSSSSHGARAWLGRGLAAVGGAGLLATAAVLDARADDRSVPHLPGRALLVAPPR
jgi:hypothetical protein